MIAEEIKINKQIFLEYANLATKRLKMGQGNEVVDSDCLAEINQRMQQIRNELQMTDTEILVRATAFID